MKPNSDPITQRRRSLRLHGFDYAQRGAYFVTVVARDHACLFGDVVDGAMRLNEAGRVAESCWAAIPDHFPHVALDAFVVMPNHVHGVVWIVGDVSADVGARDRAKDFSPLRRGASNFRSPSKTVGSVVRGFKIGVTKWMRANTGIRDVWQRNYFEHVIRNEAALHRIRQYIIDNPARWHEDRENPANVAPGRGE